MKRVSTVLLCLFLIVMASFGQGARSIRVNEVFTHGGESIQDDFGRHNPWVELVNRTFSTYNIRGMFVTTDRSVLDKNMSVPERMKRMSVIPNGDKRTILSAKEHIVLFLNSNPSHGTTHLSAKVDTAKVMWIGLYDANATDLIDSVSVPVLAANTSYAQANDGTDEWCVKASCDITPGASNYTQYQASKSERLKADDPHGFGITLMCMGIVFLCLALLYVFFLVFGWVADRRSRIARTQPIKPVVKTAKKLNQMRHATSNILQEGVEMKGRDKEIYMAVIAMAIKQYIDDVHDVESGVLTIKPKHSAWDAHDHFNNSVPLH